MRKYISQIAALVIGMTLGAALTVSALTASSMAVSDGSASVPSFTFLSENNTGIYKSAANILAMSVNGTQNYTATATAANHVGSTLQATQLGIGAAPAGASNIQFVSTVFANIATTLSANGQIAYCSDCTIANPCAGAGTGAIAKRLNGVNVCN